MSDFNDWQAVILWRDKHNAQTYCRHGDFLYELDGRDIFRVGKNYVQYVCDDGWRQCVRHEGGDFQVLPTIRTSDFTDTALWLTRWTNAHAGFALTQEIITRGAEKGRQFI